MLVAIGAFLLLRNLGYIPPNVEQWWPVILIVIGLAFVFNWSGARAEVPVDTGAGTGAPSTKPAEMRVRRWRSPTGGLILIRHVHPAFLPAAHEDALCEDVLPVTVRPGLCAGDAGPVKVAPIA